MGFIDWILEPNMELKGQHVDAADSAYMPEAPKHSCPYCALKFEGKDKLASHTRTTHPLELPMLTINGIPARTVEVLRNPIARETLDFSNITEIHLQIGHESFRKVTSAQVCEELAHITDQFANLRLVNLRINDYSTAERAYKLVFRIAPASEVESLEKFFLTRMKELPIAISSADIFYEESRAFWSHTATGEYANSLANYIIGLAIKQSELGTDHLSFDRYAQKLMECLSILSTIHTPFARGISGIIRFNLNDFNSWPMEAEAFPSLRSAAMFFLNPCEQISRDLHPRISAISKVWKCPIDDLSERIIHSVMLILDAKASTSAFQSLLPPLLQWSPLSEYDMKKIRVLMAVMYIQMKNPEKAQTYLRALRSDINFGSWAQRLIIKNNNL